MNQSILKTQMRNEIRTRRNLISAEQMEYANDMLSNSLLSDEIDDDFKEAISNSSCVALYKTVNGELPCDKVAEYLVSIGKRVCFPRVKGTGMDFYEVKDFKKDFTEGSYGILEPKIDCTLVDSDEINLMFVPAVAYTEDGQRLGQGGGYYDRYLNSCLSKGKVPFTAGVCYDFQLFSALPVEEHDFAVDCVLCVCLGDDE